MIRRVCLWLTLLAVAAVPAGCGREDDPVLTLDVESQQQISATQGNFTGPLQDGDRFGSAIGLIGDLEVDGVTDLVAGAPGDDDGGTDRGAAWVLFMNMDGTVDISQKLSDSEGGFGGILQDGDGFGSAVTGIGDLNGDTILDIAVGAPGDDDGGTDRGAVWILFMQQDGTVLFETKISDTDGNFNGVLDDGDGFGAALAVLGDLDGDGVTDLAVGAPGDDEDSPDSGAVWLLFMNSNGTVKLQWKIAFDTGGLGSVLASGDAFGSAIANIGDLNLDGIIDLAVGAPGDDDGGADAGAVWVLTLTGNGFVTHEQKLSALEGGLPEGIEAGDALGAALASAGDVNSDGIGDLLAGTPGDDDGAADSGAVWLLFPRRDGKVNKTQKISQQAGQLGSVLAAGDGFGSAVTGIGNLDLRRTQDLVAGAPLRDDGGTDTGSLWILFMGNVVTTSECEGNFLFKFFNIVDCQ